VEARETGARCRSVQAGLAGVEPQAQVCQIAGQGTQAVVDGVEVQIGEELAGEVADRQASGALQWREQGSRGEYRPAAPRRARRRLGKRGAVRDGCLSPCGWRSWWG
jgi:hypothetical protein